MNTVRLAIRTNLLSRSSAIKTINSRIIPLTTTSLSTTHATIQNVIRSSSKGLSTITSDSHSDFSKVVKRTPTPQDVKAQIENHLSESKVVLYMKGLPSSPSCGFSWKTVQILKALGVEYRAYDVLVDEHLRQGIKDYSAWPTIPQLYINGEFVGGCDIVEDMARSGELRKLLDSEDTPKEKEK